jgi:hypothetical protein
MPSKMTDAEIRLIHAYGSVPKGAGRTPIIQRYAEITHLSLGRAEDALDLWAHLTAQHRERRSNVRHRLTEAA